MYLRKVPKNMRKGPLGRTALMLLARRQYFEWSMSEVYFSHVDVSVLQVRRSFALPERVTLGEDSH